MRGRKEGKGRNYFGPYVFFLLSRVALQATNSSSSKASSGNKKKSRDIAEDRPFAGDIFLRFQHQPTLGPEEEDDGEEQSEETSGLEAAPERLDRSAGNESVSRVFIEPLFCALIPTEITAPELQPSAATSSLS